ncbi:survival of motor neuron-related-splicing factor 30-like [Ciona intestinalis]|nr:survival of motor neuron-related-splicing factor 30-like [Ciona intestinalis]|eukprot:XP_002129900.1 survival of motor neuron-related-splicing factor 30-like [Ciona intestinalis]
MEELTASLKSYKVQYAQVEAALAADEENDELLKLKQDLVEVIQLTEDLISAENEDGQGSSKSKPKLEWGIGDKCLALKADEGKYYEAVVEDILAESEYVAVAFCESGKSDICQMSALKPAIGGKAGPGSLHWKSKNHLKKEQSIAQREYRKKRNLKKKMRLKEKEAESEISKNKWKDFNKKVYSKTSKGKVKRSIFASPEGAGGKVGIGTCGVADKEMTKYDHGAKYNARHLVPR